MFFFIYAILKVPINDFIELKILEKEIGIKFVNIIETSQKVNFGKKDFPMWLWQKTKTSSAIYIDYTW